MSQITTARNQIKRHGFKGAAILTPITSVEDLDNLINATTEQSPISLLSYVGKYPTSRIDGKTIFANDRRVLAAPDADWDGTIEPSYKVTIENSKYNIEDFTINRVGKTIAYVEIQCRG